MAVQTTCKAAVYWNGAKVAKVTNITFNVSRPALDQTGLGECDGSYVSGRRDTSATGRILYDPDNQATTALMNRIFREEHLPTDSLTIKSLGDVAQGTFDGKCLITSMSVPYAVGDVMAADVTFQFSGKMTGAF